jgi:hypothetical protein
MCRPMADVSSRVRPGKMHNGLKQDILFSLFLNFVVELR